MLTICLKEFLQTGIFGNIKVGTSSKKDVIQLMGNDYDFADYGFTQIIKYDWYEFFYYTENELIYGIQNDHLTTNFNFKNTQINIDSSFLKPLITFSKVIDILDEEKIRYELIHFDKTSEYDYERDDIQLTSGVTLDFHNEVRFWDNAWKTNTITNKNNYILNGIRCFKHNYND